MEQATVKWFNDKKGYGFVALESGKEAFVHFSVIESSGFKTLAEGDTVEVEVEDGPKGLQAKRVVIAG